MWLLSTSWARRALACRLLDHSLAAVAMGLVLTAGIVVWLGLWR